MIDKIIIRNVGDCLNIDKSTKKVTIDAESYEVEQSIIKHLQDRGYGGSYDFSWIKKVLLSNNNYSLVNLFEMYEGGYPISYLLNTIGFYKKKKCLIFGNCQITIISRLLSSNPHFIDDFIIVQLPEVFKIDPIMNNYVEFASLLSQADLFLYQHVKHDNVFSPKIATDLLLEECNSDCIKICFPNSYVGFYYPQLCKIQGEIIPDNTIMPYGDSVIQSIDENTYDDANNILNGSRFNEKCVPFFQKCMEELYSRETFCDVKISDYVLDKYRDVCLAYSPNHPINEVLEEVANRILNKLNYDICPLYSNLSLNQYEMIIYPVVFKELDLKFNKDTFVLNSKITPVPLSIKEYAKYYLYYTRPSLFYRCEKTFFSPTVSLSKNVKLLTNKIAIKEKDKVTLTLSFRTNKNNEKVIIHMGAKIKPNVGKIPFVCVQESKNILLTLNNDGHVEFFTNEGWSYIHFSFWSD